MQIAFLTQQIPLLYTDLLHRIFVFQSYHLKTFRERGLHVCALLCSQAVSSLLRNADEIDFY